MTIVRVKRYPREKEEESRSVARLGSPVSGSAPRVTLILAVSGEEVDEEGIRAPLPPPPVSTEEEGGEGGT